MISLAKEYSKSLKMKILASKDNIELVELPGSIRAITYYAIRINGVLFKTPEWSYPGDEEVRNLYCAISYTG